jgi:F-type H+-transporting ATPase subunit b
MVILHQLGELFLQAVPTVILVFLFYLFMRGAFFAPVQKVIAERHAQIEGARAEAVQVEAAAKRELDTYNEAKRKALAEIYVQQENARQLVMEDRARLLKAMRARAQEDVVDAKKRIAGEVASARADIERDTPTLAREIAQAVLRESSGGPSSGAGRGGAAR